MEIKFISLFERFAGRNRLFSDICSAQNIDSKIRSKGHFFPTPKVVVITGLEIQKALDYISDCKSLKRCCVIDI